MPVSRVHRISALLAAFETGDRSLGISELSRRTAIPKTAVFRLIKDLEEVGFLERSGDGVVLGVRLFELGQQASARSSVRNVALPLMADLREATRQTIHLAILDGTDVVYIEVLRGRNAPRLPSVVGGRLPAHATGVGKALLAGSGGDATDAVITAGLTRVGPRTITAADAFRRQLIGIAARGIAYEHEESASGVACVASAIRRHDGTPIAAISASGRADTVDIRRIGPAVRIAAQSITRVLTATLEAD
ncbi:IclR family transcriptional regulator [Mycobacterium sp. M26]|uniref:IclR family transcriptional regulator n=1 Tax=Mycobacterium sp. M26 TaxID=1762962 RepID=UPI00073F1431|nr:IclR family transcriptional regulator [Mycobacterium sp. M26]